VRDRDSLPDVIDDDVIPPMFFVASVGNRGGECVGVESAFPRGGDELECSMAVESDKASGSTDNARKVKIVEVGEEGAEQVEDESFVTPTAGKSGWEILVSGALEGGVASVGVVSVALALPKNLFHTVRTTGC